MGVSVPVPGALLGQPRNVRFEIPERTGQLTAEQMDSLGPSIRALRMDPDTVAHAIGDTVSVTAEARVLALDSASNVLGELRAYELEFLGSGFRMQADGRVLVTKPGTVTFTARLPDRYWRGPRNARPAATLTILVHR
jgi:hypothetical protein